jgi:hypothetical protein
MTTDNIDAVLTTYTVLNDSLEMIKRLAPQPIAPAVTQGTFVKGKSATEIEDTIEYERLEFNDVMVVSLFAAFERELRSAFLNAVNTDWSAHTPTMLNIRGISTDAIERWAVLDMVAALRDVVDGNLRGEVKEIYAYRNWVAHGKNIRRTPARQAVPRQVYQTLARFIRQAATVMSFSLPSTH